MEAIPALAQYLLAVQKIGETKSIRYGALSVIIPIFPPATTISFTVTPLYGGFCDIFIQHRYSQIVVPHAFEMEILHQGMQIEVGSLESMIKMPGQLWVEVKEASPIVVTYTNVSGLTQYLDGLDEFLIIDSEQTYNETMKLVRNWGAMEPITVGGA